MGYVDFVVIALPAAIALATLAIMGPKRGVPLGVALTAFAIIGLIPIRGIQPDWGAESIGFAVGRFCALWQHWVPAFVGGSIIGAWSFAFDVLPRGEWLVLRLPGLARERGSPGRWTGNGRTLLCAEGPL